MFKEYNEQEKEENESLVISNIMNSFPSNHKIWEWWKTQRFQKEQGEQEYTMLYEIDLPKILKAFTEHLLLDMNRK